MKKCELNHIVEDELKTHLKKARRASLMKNIVTLIKEELVLKLDFVKWEFEIGWIWVILQIPTAYVMLRNIVLACI